MNTKSKFSMAELGFLSVSRWLQHIANSAGLEEVSLSAIFSFSIVPDGVAALVHKKELLAAAIELNQSKLIEWVRIADLDFDSKELVIIRSLWFSNRRNLKILRGHVATAKELGRYEQKSVFDGLANEGGVDDELPF